MHGILWPLLGMLVCLAGLCVVIGVVARARRRPVNRDDAPTGDGDADRTR